MSQLGGIVWDSEHMNLDRTVAVGQEKRDQPRTAVLEKINPQNLPMN